MPTPSPGKLEKLTIFPFKDAAFSQKAGSPYSVLVNPEKYTHAHTISYNNQQAPGTPGVSTKFEKIAPETISFELVFDATGVIQGSPANLQTEIQNFKNTIYTYNGDIHSPNYLKLSWGSMLFKGRLTSMQLNYTLFKPDGTPLRAKASVSFEEYTDAQTIALESDKKSPDLTHVRTVLAGDTLPLLCYRFYGDSSYYTAVADVNGLTDFRNIRPGDQLTFPPLQK